MPNYPCPFQPPEPVIPLFGEAILGWLLDMEVLHRFGRLSQRSNVADSAEEFLQTPPNTGIWEVEAMWKL